MDKNTQDIIKFNHILATQPDLNKHDQNWVRHQLAKARTRDEIIRWLKDLNTRYHLTIKFGKPIPEYQAEREANRLLSIVHEEYFRRHSPDHLAGYCFREYQQRGVVHYHLLIEDHPVFKAKRNQHKDLQRVLEDACLILGREVAGDNRKERCYPIDPFEGFLLQNYYEDRLESYLTKSLEDRHWDFDFIAPLGYEGFRFPNHRRTH